MSDFVNAWLHLNVALNAQGRKGQQDTGETNKSGADTQSEEKRTMTRREAG